MKKPFFIFPVLFVASFFMCRCSESPKQEAGTEVPVRTETARRVRQAQPVRTSGRLSSASEIKLSFKAGGLIDRISVHEGTVVRKGRVLASLKLDEIEAQVEQARVGHDKALRDFNRVRKLYQDSVVTLEQLQNAESGLRVAESNLRIAEFNLDHAVITAPSDGRVLKRMAEPGELIGPGTPVLYFGGQSGPWVVKAGVIDRDVIRLSLGDSASVRFDAYPSKSFPGSVQEIAAGPNPMNGLYEVEVGLSPFHESLFNGFVAGVEIHPSRIEEGVAVPFASLTDVRGLSGYVYRIGEDGLAVKTPVEIAYFQNGGAVIRGGLKGGESLVTEGAAYLNGTSEVRIVDDAK